MSTRPTRSRAPRTELETDMPAPAALKKAVKAVSNSSAGRTASQSKTASAASKQKRPVQSETTGETSTPKRRKSAAPPPTLTPTKHLTNPIPYTPSLLPPTLSFNLQTAIDHLSTHDPRFRQMFTHLPCKPFVPPYTALDPFKTLVTSIIGQQVSSMAARAITNRFKGLFGYDGEEGFPGPGEIASEDPLRLKSAGLSLRKAEYVISIAQHFLSGELSTELLRDGTDEEISKALIAVRGIGQWTVDMFLMFSLRRPDVLAVGDLGVQKGLLRWALAAHGVMPESKKQPNAKAAEKWRPKKEVVKEEVDIDGNGEIDTHIREATPEPQAKNGLPPTPLTPNGEASTVGVLHTPGVPANLPRIPPTPGSPSIPAQVLEVPARDLPPPTPTEFLSPPKSDSTWNADRAAPLTEGLSVEVLKSRLSGKKAKGGMYLTPKEMEVLTDGWRPYRSLAVYYMWPAGEDF